MPSWVTSKLYLNDRFAIFLVPVRRDQGLHEQFVNSITDQDIAEQFVRALVEQERPELNGCLIYFIDFDPNLADWQIGVAHPSLERVPMGCLAKQWMLKKSEDL